MTGTRAGANGPIAFLLNTGAGKGGEPAWLEANRAAIRAIAQGGPVIQISGGNEIDAAVRRALDAGCRSIVAGGGDGTLNSVASRLVGTETTLGVLPLGTLNHFAKDLGIPMDPTEALATIAAGHSFSVDVGEVNGRHFLNNSSLGLYPDIVRDRKRQQRRLGRGKWMAFAWAVWGAMRRAPFLSVRLTVDGTTNLHRTPFVFVGNNVYSMEGFRIGHRAGLTDGTLSVYVADGARRWRLVALGFRALFGKLRQSREFREYRATELRVDSPRRRMVVATDGEVTIMTPPFNYRIHAAALRVFVPATRDTSSSQ
ncbi:MAG: diacylglycerol kinase family protein [Betaproteobacteria bacterium]